jgi:hypothetical protein
MKNIGFILKRGSNIIKMAENNSTEYPYLVNHTKKEIRQIPFSLTIWTERNGWLKSLSLTKDLLVTTYRTLRSSEWSGFDDTTFIRDHNNKIRDYLNNGYVLK